MDMLDNIRGAVNRIMAIKTGVGEQILHKGLFLKIAIKLVANSFSTTFLMPENR